jgi:hypothetical protein
MPDLYVDVSPLFGLTDSDRDVPRMELNVSIGYDFGPQVRKRTE